MAMPCASWAVTAYRDWGFELDACTGYVAAISSNSFANVQRLTPSRVTLNYDVRGMTTIIAP
jgi:hypothetical protein